MFVALRSHIAVYKDFTCFFLIIKIIKNIKYAYSNSYPHRNYLFPVAL